MPLTLADVSLNPRRQKLSNQPDGLKALIQNIIAESNSSNIKVFTPTGVASKDAFFNHNDNRDPSTAGGKAPSTVDIQIYYVPASRKEYDNYDVVDKAVGLLSGRKRLAVRKENGKVSFWLTEHPKEDPRTRTNGYGAYLPVDCTA